VKSVAMSAGVVVARQYFLAVIKGKEIKKVEFVFTVITSTSENELQKQRHIFCRRICTAPNMYTGN
jgi:hypothetical protein